MSELRRFLLLWKALEPRRRREIRRFAWFGRRAPDPETAWFVTTFTASLTTGWRGVVLVGFSLLWTALGAITITVIQSRGVDRPFAFGLAIAQIVAGLLGLVQQAMFRRARRVNEPVAVPTRGDTSSSGC